MQKMHPNGMIFDGGMNLDRNGDEAEGEDTVSDNPSH
jgi:hypothetical protein